jgi:hypothetical protein
MAGIGGTPPRRSAATAENRASFSCGGALRDLAEILQCPHVRGDCDDAQNGENCRRKKAGVAIRYPDPHLMVPLLCAEIAFSAANGREISFERLPQFSAGCADYSPNKRTGPRVRPTLAAVVA